MLFYVVARIAPDECTVHVDALSGLFGGSATTSVVERERRVAGLRAAAAPQGWFGQPMRDEHAAPLHMLSMGVMFDRLVKTAA